MKALTYVNLPPDNRKAPGDPITQKELEAAGQSKEDIAALKKSGAIGDDNAKIDKAHEPVTIEGTPGHVNVVTGEYGEGGDTDGQK